MGCRLTWYNFFLSSATPTRACTTFTTTTTTTTSRTSPFRTTTPSSLSAAPGRTTLIQKVQYRIARCRAQQGLAPGIGDPILISVEIFHVNFNSIVAKCRLKLIRRAQSGAECHKTSISLRKVTIANCPNCKITPLQTCNHGIWHRRPRNYRRPGERIGRVDNVGFSVQPSIQHGPEKEHATGKDDNG